MLALTVGIPVFNEEYAIVRAISSVLNQSLPSRYEILIVDDGSTDATATIVADLATRIPAIRLVQHETNLGRPAARSTLARTARGLWFAMLDADDEWYPDKLRRQFEVVAEYEAASKPTDRLMVCGNIHHIDLDKRTERIKNFAEGYGRSYGLARVLKGDNAPISQFALLRTAFLREIGDFDPSLRRAQDWDFLIRFFLAGGHIEFLPNPPLAMFNFRRSGRDPAIIETCMLRVIDKHHTEYARLGLDPDNVRRSIRDYIESFRSEPA